VYIRNMFCVRQVNSSSLQVGDQADEFIQATVRFQAEFIQLFVSCTKVDAIVYFSSINRVLLSS